MKKLDDYKSENKKELKVYFCPKCNSNNVRYVFGFGNIFGIVPMMKCFSCKFKSQMFPQKVFDKEKLEIENKKVKNKVNKKNKRKKR